jgi:integrase
MCWAFTGPEPVRTSATLALAAGFHAKIVQERLGHTNIAATMNVYSHAVPRM